MKPISEWTEDELQRTADSAWHEDYKAFAAEVLRLRAENEALMDDLIRSDLGILKDLRLRAERAEADLAAARAHLDEALELAEEAIPYAGEYFDEKWDLTKRLNELRARNASQ